jgi:competence protein ComEC
MTSRSLGHRAPLLWIVLPLTAGLAVGKAFEIASAGWPLGIALVAAAGAAVASWTGRRGWAAAMVVAMTCAGIASHALHRARLAAWAALPAREARLSLRVDRVFPQPEGRRATGLATVMRSEAHLHDLAGQRLYFSLTLGKGETPPIRSATIATVGVLVTLPANPRIRPRTRSTATSPARA